MCQKLGRYRNDRSLCMQLYDIAVGNQMIRPDLLSGECAAAPQPRELEPAGNLRMHEPRHPCASGSCAAISFRHTRRSRTSCASRKACSAFLYSGERLAGHRNTTC